MVKVNTCFIFWVFLRPLRPAPLGPLQHPLKFLQHLELGESFQISILMACDPLVFNLYPQALHPSNIYSWHGSQRDNFPGWGRGKAGAQLFVLIFPNPGGSTEHRVKIQDPGERQENGETPVCDEEMGAEIDYMSRPRTSSQSTIRVRRVSQVPAPVPSASPICLSPSWKHSLARIQ